MSQVTIEGTINRNTAIQPGERVTTEYTPLIRNLVRRGFAKIVDTPQPDTTDTVDDDAVNVLPKPEANASKQDWRDYLDSIGLTFNETDTRNQLRARANGIDDE